MSEHLLQPRGNTQFNLTSREGARYSVPAQQKHRGVVKDVVEHEGGGKLGGHYFGWIIGVFKHTQKND